MPKGADHVANSTRSWLQSHLQSETRHPEHFHANHEDDSISSAHLGSEAELVGVLGHEIGHVTARHGANQMSKGLLAQAGLGVVAAIDSPRLGDAIPRIAEPDPLERWCAQQADRLTA